MKHAFSIPNRILKMKTEINQDLYQYLSDSNDTVPEIPNEFTK